MLRAFHRWPGLIALALVTVLALSGAVLSVFPAAERLAAPQSAQDMSVATLVTRIQTAFPGVEQIKRAPSGQITAYWFDQGVPSAALIDPATGQAIGPADPNPVLLWFRNLHRSLFLDDAGRIAAAVGSLAMLVLSLSGMALVQRRVGGLRRWFTPLRGPLPGRVHVELARVAVVGLLLSSITALWMSASTFSLLPDGAITPVAQEEPSGETGMPLARIATLAETPVTQLRELTFPYPDDPTDVFTLKTDGGTALIDQGNGALLAWADLTRWQAVSETIYMLHTGQGAATLGLVLGLMALSVPAMGVAGVLVWLAGRRGRPRIRQNSAAGQAETIVLVGSENGSTWGFAATLHGALTAAGQKVHVGPMAGFAPARYGKAQRILVLAATYGDGAAPVSAKGFLDRLAAGTGGHDLPIAVLGFGDRSFPAFCGFAKAVTEVAENAGWRALIPFDTVDRQSPQDFARWGHALGAALGLDLTLAHQPVAPAARQLTLVSRRDYGAEVQAPTTILRFALPKVSLWQRLTRQGFAGFQAGDLIGVLPEGSAVPRFYSLASGWRDGFIEIVVRKHPGGLCSGQLTALELGDSVAAFLRPNPNFRLGRGRAPVILIGAGTGIGPLAGFIRANKMRRPMHLFFGMRHPDSDYLYGPDLEGWRAVGAVSSLVTAVSRGAKPHYVQDALRNEAAEVARLIRAGARVMVCGGRDMAAGVGDALADILLPVGLTPAMLKAEGRYVEDVY